MRIKVKGLHGWWMVPLLSVASLAAGGGDLRLVEAVKKGDQEAVRFLLKESASVNERQADGSTALAWATHRDDLQTMELLIREGADVNAANDYGVTPLSLACTNRNAAMVDKLLEAGADPKATLGTGETVLMTCARTGNADAVKSLLDHGADPNAKESRRGQTALMWALAGRHPEAARALIEHGADIHAQSKGGFTPLLFASQQGDLDSARILLAAGADVNKATPEHGNALTVASASGHEALPIFLLEKGADPNTADGYGITPLHHALQKGVSGLAGVRYYENYRLAPPNLPLLVKALLAHGANPNARIAEANERGPDGTPTSMAVATPFFLAAITADTGLMRALGAGGADPLLANKDGVTPLMAAAISACFGTCSYQGGNRAEEEGEKKVLEAVKVVVELGADVNAADKNGLTAMHAAAFTGADAIVQFLADAGAKVNVKDKAGQTPWSMAEGISPLTRRRGLYGTHKSTLDLLLRLGATPLTAEEIEALIDY